MFDFINGRIVSLKANNLVLLNNGIGYDITVSTSTASKCSGKEEVQIFTYLHVREDGISLYGFFDREEKQLFLRLIEVSGIGPKVAMSILSGLSYDKLIAAISSGNVHAVKAIKGIGAKTAERIILELKDKVTPSEMGTDAEYYEAGSNADDALLGLMALGIGRGEAMAMLAKVKDKDTMTAEDIIKSALRGGK